MEGIDNIVAMIDYMLNTQRKRHIVGGILISMSALFGGLAVTTLTIKQEDESE
jgi:hypothetical protein